MRILEIGPAAVGVCPLSQVDDHAAAAAALTMTLVESSAATALPQQYVAVDSVDAAIKELENAITSTPCAARVLTDRLLNPGDDVPAGLLNESTAYSMLLAGPEFAAWRSSLTASAPTDPVEPAVLVDRTDNVLTLTLNRPDRHNAFGRWVRDATCDALDIALLDPSITAVRLRGAGPSFCSGGDLDEFGTQSDVVLGHLIRTDRSVGRRLHELRERVTVEVHGACIGAGLELPAFAGRVVAHSNARFALPELAMGLIPGAGGTVSLPSRIGRWADGLARDEWCADRRRHRARLGLVDDRVD